MRRSLAQKIVLFTFLLTFPSTALAQVNTGSSTSGVLGQYNPQINTGSGSSFNGLSISGVGGALAGCANIGGRAINGINSLFSSSSSPTPAQNNTSSTNAPTSSNTGSSGFSGSGGNNVPVSDSGTQSKINEGNTELKSANKREDCLNGVAYALAKSLLSQMTNKALNWINTGLGGNPLYVQDVGSYMRSIRDQKLGNYLNSVDTGNSIFGSAIKSAITQEVTGYSDGYIDKISGGAEYTYQYNNMYCKYDYEDLEHQDEVKCGTVDTSIAGQSPTTGSNPDALKCKTDVRKKYDALAEKNCVSAGAKKYSDFQSDFTQGGWDSWFSSIENDNNNPIGAFFNSSQQISDDINTEQQNQKDAIQRNQGFLDIAKCVEWKDGIDKMVVDQETGLTTTPYCLKYSTVTPGSVISDQVKSYLGTPQRQLELADNINEVLGAFFDQLVNGLISNGLRGLSGNSTGTSYAFGPGNNIVVSSAGTPIASSAFQQNVLGYQSSTTSVGAVQEFDISRPQQIRALLQAQYNYLNRTKDSVAVMSRITPTLGALDYCIPGPNPDWKNQAQNNTNTFVASLQEPPPQADDLSFIDKVDQYLQNIPGMSLIIGTKNFILGLFGGKKEPPKTVFAYVFQMYDKVTDSRKDVVGGVYSAYADSSATIRSYFQGSYEPLKNVLDTTYTPTLISGWFKAGYPTENKTYIDGFVNDSLAETKNLVVYSRNVSDLSVQYDTQIANTEQAITELESIRNEVNNIVSVAKARYIKEQAAAGTPVNQACIDQAYVIDMSPIVPVARLESDTLLPIVVQSRAAGYTFYDKLNKP